MKIKGPVILLFMLISMLAAGQDLIVTGRGDSLNVRISSVERDKIYFNRRVGGELQRGIFYRDSLTYFERGYFETSDIPKKSSELNRFRVGITAGGGFQTGDYTLKDYSFQGSEDFAKSLRWGYMLGAEGVYYFNDIIGIGLRYNFFSASASSSDSNIIVSEWRKTGKDQPYKNITDTISGDLQEKIFLNFLGPEVSLRIISKSGKIRYNTSFAFGLMLYHNDYVLGKPSSVSANNLCMDLSFCPEFLINKNLALGVEFSFLFSSFSKYNQVEGEVSQTVDLDRNAVSMSRIDVGLSLKWFR